MSKARMSSARMTDCMAAICAVLLCVPCVGAAQTARPEAVGFSSERLERVAELMQRQIDAHAFPGSVTLIARDGRILYIEAQGLMDIEARRPMREDAVFRIMSMTKPVVAVSILMLAEEGKLRIADPVARFLSDFEDVPVTLRDLLTHTAGFMTTGGASEEFGIEIGASETLADVVPRLAGVPLDFEPGTRWSYSGQFGFDVLARIVEIAAAMPFDEFAESRIFQPLGMRNTYFFPDSRNSRVATLYASVDGKLVEEAEMAFVNGVYFSGGGGLFSTAEDYLRFARMLLDGGELDGQRILSRRAVELMRSVHIPASLPGRTPGEGYGLGVRVVTDPAVRNTWLSTGSFGWSGAFNTHFFIDPVERIIGIFMTQSAFYADRQQLRDDFEVAVMQALID
jgi:CubicO group peptidase (beta-lactamase class C family)